MDHQLDLEVMAGRKFQFPTINTRAMPLMERTSIEFSNSQKSMTSLNPHLSFWRSGTQLSLLASLALCVLTVVAAAGGGAVWAADIPSTGLGVSDAARDIVVEYCFDCHDAESSKGDLNLERALDSDPLVREARLWRNVIARIENHDMPPEDKPQPSDEEREIVLAWLDEEINQFDYSQVDDPGYEPIRRLTHIEYSNTIRDLFGIDLDLAHQFPMDLSGTTGFDNTANTLFMNPMLIERYAGVVDEIIDSVLPNKIETEAHQKVHDRIFAERKVEGNPDIATARRILNRFMDRAFRRSVEEAELELVLGHYSAKRSKGDSFESAVKQSLGLVLLSPSFLYRIETVEPGVESYRISDWDRASRLSYFLWASMPDDELFALAGNGTLGRSDVLEEQIARMLTDPKADTLGTVFAAQWLGFDDLGTRVRLDPIDNPWCTDTLMTAMKQETSMFFMSLLRENQPISRLIDADYTFVNEEVARLYRMEGIEGERMRRVSLVDSPRGGIFGQGSLMAVTSFPGRTSPVIRGIWVLDTVLGTPPPDPPPNVSEFDEEIEENRKLSTREKLAAHRANPRCAGCHDQIDPLGVSLENYDWFGRWRETHRRQEIDTGARLPDGTEFSGPVGLKKVIIEKRQDDLLRQTTRKMLAYALGRQLEFYDESAVIEIVSHLKSADFRFQTLVREVVNSYPFQYKKNQPE